MFGRLFDFLCLLSVIIPYIIATTQESIYQVGDLAYAGSYGQDERKTRLFYPLQQPHTQTKDYRHQKKHINVRKKSLVLNPKERDLSSYKSVSSSTSRDGFSKSKPLEKRPEDVDQRFLLILNVRIPPKSFTSNKERSFSNLLTHNLNKHEYPGTRCDILHNTPISKSKVQLEVYCKDTKAWQKQPFIPAPSLAKSLDTPEMKPFLSHFNVTAYGTKNTPEMSLEVYQEMWFPVAVVAGVSMLLIVLAIACLLVCRKRMAASDEEEQTIKQADSEKLLYPPVHPIQTITANMIQPEAGRVYTISGKPLKPRKWTGSPKSLLDRRGSTHSLVLDLTSSSTDLRPGSPTSLSIKESPVEEKLQSKSKPLSYEKLEEAVDNTKQLYAEFWEIPMNHPAPEDRIPGSSYRNRYPFILPNSRTRVILPEIPGNQLSTYINANAIRGYNGERNAFIATQGPLSCTINDFWRMIWYHHCPIIVMITKLKERNETKCERYWPDPTFKMQEKYGDVVVTFDSALGRDGYQITSLYVSHSQSLEAPRRVYHYWYTAWPDHGVPESPRQLLQLVDEVHLAQEREGGKTGPAVVHCSAGIGRTGCFTATSIGMKQIQKENCIDILKIVCLMRIDRGGMVETDSQYEFVYRTLHHHWRQLRSGRGRDTSDGVLEAMFEDKITSDYWRGPQGMWAH